MSTNKIYSRIRRHELGLVPNTVPSGWVEPKVDLPVKAGLNTAIMYDAIPANAIPSNAVVCSGYCDANFAFSWIDMVHRFPALSAEQRVVSIGSRFSTIARCIDIEAGNPVSPGAQTAQWIVDMVNHGVYRPAAYASHDAMVEIQNAMVQTSLRRDQFCLNLAEWTYDPVKATARVQEGFDAVQFSDQGGGGAYDISVINLDTYVPPLTPPKPVLSDVAHAELDFNAVDKQWTLTPAKGPAVNWTDMPAGKKASLLVQVEEPGFWSIEPLDWNFVPPKK